MIKAQRKHKTSDLSVSLSILAHIPTPFCSFRFCIWKHQKSRVYCENGRSTTFGFNAHISDQTWWSQSAGHWKKQLKSIRICQEKNWKTKRYSLYSYQKRREFRCKQEGTHRGKIARQAEKFCAFLGHELMSVVLAWHHQRHFVFGPRLLKGGTGWVPRFHVRKIDSLSILRSFDFDFDTSQTQTLRFHEFQQFRASYDRKCKNWHHQCQTAFRRYKMALEVQNLTESIQNIASAESNCLFSKWT